MNNLFGLRTLAPNVKYVLAPVILISVLAVLTFFVLKEGVLRTKLLMNELTIVEKSITTLEERLDVLTEVKEKLQKTDSTVTALPNTNSILFVISHLRESAGLNNIVLTELREANSPVENEGIKQTELIAELTTEGVENLFTLLEFLKHTAPISTFGKVVINKTTDNLVDAEIKIGVYWSDFPTSIVSLDSPIEGLNERDTKLLSEISGLTLPRFAILSPNPPVVRENPFINTNI